MARSLSLAGALGAALVAASCGGGSLAVRSHPHPEGAPAEPVSFPPPPAQLEHLDDAPPAQGCQWADGQWVWVSQRWDWRPGGWIRPPENCRYSAPALEWGPGGQTGVLYYRPGRWYSTGSLEACPEPVSCPSQSPAPALGAPRAP